MNETRCAVGRVFVCHEPEEAILPEITIRLHPDLAERLLAAEPEGARTLSSLWRQVEGAVRSSGRRIAYAPAVLPDGLLCAMSVHIGLRGMVVEVDRPGTLIPGRGVVPERDDALQLRRLTPARRKWEGRVSPPLLAGLLDPRSARAQTERPPALVRYLTPHRGTP